MADGEGKRRVAVLGVSSLILVAMVVAVTVGVNRSDDPSEQNNHQVTATSSMRAIKAICQPTDYQEVCVEQISSASGNTTDPKDLIRVGFEVAINHIREAAKNSTVLQELHSDPLTRQALENCQELAESAADDLKRSFDHFAEINFSNYDQFFADLKTWLSGAITYQETCLDGFENTSGDAEEKMRQYLQTSMQLTSNALAMVTEISSALSSLSVPTTTNRRLLSSEEYIVSGHGEMLPMWFNPGNRKLLEAGDIVPDLVVAKDGSGKYKTINEALKDIPIKSNNTFVLYIKEGVYEEKVQINRNMTHVMIVGDGPTKTRITGSLNFIDGVNTFATATVVILGDHFIAKDIGFENSAGAAKHQAVALRVGADMSVFYNCQMDGYQDTLYAHTYRQYYRNCVISGTIDFIFGDSSVLFQNCTMVVRKPLDNQQCIVTAQGRKDSRQPTGIVLQDCKITSDPEYYPVRNTLKSYLGRPWKEYSRTIIMESYIDDLIQPDGFLPWNATFGLDTCFYSEANNRGPGAATENRVKWQGIKKLAPGSVNQFTAAQFLEGDSWIPATSVPYNSGLVYSAANVPTDVSPALAATHGAGPASSPTPQPKSAAPVPSPRSALKSFGAPTPAAATPSPSSATPSSSPSPATPSPSPATPSPSPATPSPSPSPTASSHSPSPAASSPAAFSPVASSPVASGPSTVAPSPISAAPGPAFGFESGVPAPSPTFQLEADVAAPSPTPSHSSRIGVTQSLVLLKLFVLFSLFF